MEETAQRAIAIVGVGAILPDAPDAAAFWKNLEAGRYSVSDVDPSRWDPAEYYDPDPHAPDKTYSKIGGWVRSWSWDPVAWHLPIPPRVADAMDDGQKWAVACTREALLDYGWPKRPFDPARTAVILGNAMAGERHYLTALRVFAPEYAQALAHAPSFAALPASVQAAALAEMRAALGKGLPPITEDTMPGELSNCIAGRIANLFDFHGPNYVVDAACASAMAAFSAAVEGLTEHDFDIAITGGIDRNMGPSAFVKFCKIGALSATGTRPYADGADGFVMGEGAAIFVLKRLADAERDGDRVYAVIRGIGGASDGKGKGITAPNPVGQRLAIARAWENAGLSPATATLVEGHGTSTKVGDVVEMESLTAVFGAHGIAPHSIALGSVKSNIGHLKAAAGAAGVLKAALAVHHKKMPPSIGFARPNPGIDFTSSPFRVNTELRAWEPEDHDHLRRAGVSAFGFGGTNFHVVLEEHVPGRLTRGARPSAAVPATITSSGRGALVVGAATLEALAKKLAAARHEAEAGHLPGAPDRAQIEAAQRIAFDFGDAAELTEKIKKAEKALAGGGAAAWKALRGQGIFRGAGPAGKVAFLYTGQGSQYVNMLRRLRAEEPIVADTFAEAEKVLLPLLGGKRLTDLVFVDPHDREAVARAEEGLKQTEITQPAVLSTDIALTRLFAARGFTADLVMGHSLGEYGALVAAGALPFADALEAVSARGREMAATKVEDHGWMAAISAPLPEVRRILATVRGYVVIANINSLSQSVIGGASAAVEGAMRAFQEAGYEAVRLPVSHAFHTSIVAPASEPLGRVLARLGLRSPRIPIVANVTGELYPTEHAAMLDLLSKQVAAPVEFVKGLETLYAAGARVFVEVGPKKALAGFVEDVLGGRGDVSALFSNHPKLDDLVAFNQAICGLYAAGIAPRREARSAEIREAIAEPAIEAPVRTRAATEVVHEAPVITGAALGLPGTERVFDDANVGRILHGEQLIDVVPSRFRRAMLDKQITRLVKGDDGSAAFASLRHPDEVIRLAARAGRFDLEQEFGIAADRIPALDIVTKLAIAAGLDALRDAGIPLVMRYRTTSKGTRLPDRWSLPESLRDETGVIFASAFPGYDALVEDMDRYHRDRARRERLALIESIIDRAGEGSALAGELGREAEELRAEVDEHPYVFDRRFLFRILAMGHSQFAELIGARGPNTQVNSACASTTQAIALADDWIRAGRCRRVVVVGADDVTSDNLLEWIGAGFLVTGAAATDDVVEDAALPFDRRRHGMLLGMGAAGLVVESPAAARERGLGAICEVVGAATANSAFHGTRLDVDHIGQVMERLVAAAEARTGARRADMAREMAFVSHETYTPARGGSASAEVHALRGVFGADADRIVMANTKGFTGHPMGVGIEDVIAVKMLETGMVPPVANFREIDPDLGKLNLSRGGAYPIRWALRLAAGFGSQISMTLLRWTPPGDGAHRRPGALGYRYRVADPSRYEAWLSRVSEVASPELEVVQRTLRVKAGQAPAAKSIEAAPKAKPVVVEARPAPVEVKRAPEPAPVRVEAAPAPIAKAPEAVVAAPIEDAVKTKVLAIIAEKTGYPIEMLDMDLDLEADLGIDTVKQAETFAAVRAAYAIPREEKLRLRDFPTLAKVVQFVYDRRPDLAQKRAAPVIAAPVIAAPVVKVDHAAPVSDPAPVDDEVKTKVLSIIAEKTGYPIEMLDMDLDLEADLGIDTVKQAETFAAVRTAYAIPREEKLRLRDFPTLAKVVQFVYDRRPDLAKKPAAPVIAAPPAVVEQAAPAADPAPVDDEVKAKVLSIIAEKTGYPIEMLDMDLDLEADLGIDTVKQAETFAAVRAAYAISREEKLRLRDFPTLAKVVQFVYDRRPDLAQKQAAPVIAAPAPEVAKVEVIAAPIEARVSVPRRVAVPVLRPALDRCKATSVSIGPGSRVVVMLDEGGAGAALVQALGALGAETLAIEAAPDVSDLLERIGAFAAAGPITGVYWLPALDVEPAIGELDHAGWRAALFVRVKLFAHVMRALYAQVAGPGTFLVSATRLGGAFGYDAAGASAPMGGAVAGFTKAYAREREGALVKVVDFAIGVEPDAITKALLDETRLDPGVIEIGHQGGERWSIGLAELPVSSEPGLALNKESVFVVTGAAGSIVAAIVADLAAASGGTFHLLDLTSPPRADDADLARYDGGDREALKRDLFDRIKARGERATPAMVEKQMAALERASAALSAIRAVSRAGGVARYHQVDLRDPTAVAAAIAEVRAAHGKVDVLVHAAGLEVSRFLPDKDPREFDLVFDVKADGWHNLLCAIGDMPLGAAVVFSSIAGRFGNGGQTDYSAANDLLCKMASSLGTSRPGARGIAVDWTAWAGIGMASRGSIPRMMEAAGIDMLPPEAGIPVIRRELTAGKAAVEIVVGGRLGALLRDRDPEGGADVARIVPAARGPMITRVIAASPITGLSVEVDLDPAAQAFLHDHRIDGTPVLPGVMGMEAFAEVAALAAPGFVVTALEDVRFEAPFKLYRDEPRRAVVTAFARREGEEIVAECRLVGSRVLAGRAEAQEVVHFTGKVRLARAAAAPRTLTAEKPERAADLDPAEIYRVYFHGPAYQVLEGAWIEGDRGVGVMAASLPPNHAPASALTVLDPRVVELCFQTAGLWELRSKGALALPRGVDRVDILASPEPGGRVLAVTRAEGASFAAEAIDDRGRVIVALRGYRTIALPAGAAQRS